MSGRLIIELFARKYGTRSIGHSLQGRLVFVQVYKRFFTLEVLRNPENNWRELRLREVFCIRTVVPPDFFADPIVKSLLFKEFVIKREYPEEAFAALEMSNEDMLLLVQESPEMFLDVWVTPDDIAAFVSALNK